jgi:hypothetical protein
MADEREGQALQSGGAANEDKIQTTGREANGAQPLNAAPDNAGPERYPSAGRDDSVGRTGRTEQVSGEARAVDAHPDNPEPPQGAGDSSTPTSANEGRFGPGADPAEGKR